MKKTTYIFSIILAAGLFSSSIGFGFTTTNQEKNKETVKEQPRKESNKIPATGTVKQAGTESVWLNKRNFPQLQDSACPFYLKPAGC
jgi:hypothetical protein